MKPASFLRLFLLSSLVSWLAFTGLARAAETPPAVAILADTNAAPANLGTNAPKKPQLPPVLPLSFTNVLSAGENKDWLTQPLWTAVPRGRTNDFAGVRFWLDGLIQLQGKQSAGQKKTYREKVALTLPQPTNFATLHLLGGMSWDAPAGTKVAEVVWRYADGTFRRSPLSYGVHMRDWWGRRYEEPATVSDPHSKAVWRGAHPDASKQGKSLRLYRTSLANPATNKPVKSLEFVSAMANPTLFLVGITADPLPPGARDKEFADLDEGRPGLTGTQYVTVVDSATGKPIAGAKVKTHGRELQGTPDFAEYDREGVTGGNGTAAVQKSEQGLERLEIRVEAEDYAGYRKDFDLKKGEILPPNLEVKLKGGLTIGGIVQDPDGRPLAGAKVSAGAGGWSSEEERKVIEEHTFNHREVTTDAEGKWQVKSVPAPLLPNLHLSASHPDYVAVGIGLRGGNEKVEAELKKQTHVVKLLRGCEVVGVVLGPDDQPFAGATVKAGHRWSGDGKHETKSGSDGRFHLRNLKAELQAVTATADGHNPASKAITPGTNVIELTLRLKKGASLKGIVLNPEGQPGADARLVYVPSNYDQRDNLEWEGRSDENSRFEWTSAPETEVEFYVHKEGFAQKRNVKAKAGEEDNIIRLSRARKVLGVVGDAQSSEPLTTFTVSPAQGTAEQFQSWSDSDRKSFTDPQGHFAFDLDDESHNVIKVAADDHLPKIVVLPPPQNDYGTVTVLLEPSESPAGLVVDPAGRPMPGVEVGLIGKGGIDFRLAAGRLRTYGSGRLVKTDEQGRFKLAVLNTPLRVVAASEAGFAEATMEEFQQTKTLVLLPWGRIEATVLSGGRPVAGRSYMLSTRSGGWGEGSLLVDSNGYKSETDAEGKFTMNKVPAGQRGLVRLIQIDANSWTHAQNIPVEVKPGETTQVTIGGTGATVSGRADGQAVMAGKEGAKLDGGLGTPYLGPPKGQDYRAWSELPENKALMQAVRNFTAEFKPDGTFSFDGVPPGQYTLNLMAMMPTPGGKQWETTQLGQISQPVTVPDEAANGVVSLELGSLVLQPSPPPPPARPPGQ